MNWNNIPNDERLRLWKKIREDIATLPLELQLSKIAEFCSKMPFGYRSLDYYDPTGWPSPWEILFYGSFCISSISLLIFYTLILSSNDINVELYLVEDKNDIYLLPVIIDQFILNFAPGTVNNYQEVCDTFVVLQKYTKEQIKKIE